MRTMMIPLLALALTAPACGTQKSKSKSEPGGMKAGDPHAGHMMAKDMMARDPHAGHMHAMDPHAGHMHGAAGMVKVPKAGKKYAPPIKPAQLMAGDWYCEMGGTVHWAQGEKKDGKCPLCKMKLHLKNLRLMKLHLKSLRLMSSLPKSNKMLLLRPVQTSLKQIICKMQPKKK